MGLPNEAVLVTAVGIAYGNQPLSRLERLIARLGNMRCSKCGFDNPGGMKFCGQRTTRGSGSIRANSYGSVLCAMFSQQVRRICREPAYAIAQ
jgi:hypothetical protein